MQASHDDIDLSGVVGAIKRGLPRLLAVTGLVGVLTYGVLLLVPPTYKSTAQVILERPTSSLLRPSGQQAVSEVRIDDNEVASQAEVIRSRDLLAGVVAVNHLQELPEFDPMLRSQSLLGRIASLFGPAVSGTTPAERALSMLDIKTKVSEVPKTRLLNIEVSSYDSALAAKLANAIAQAYLDRNRSNQVKDASDATVSIGESIAEVKAETEAAEAALERFRAESGLLSGQNNVTLNSQQLSELNTQLNQATAARTEAEARSRILRDMIASGRVENSQEVVKSPNMQQLFQQKLRVERDIGELSATLLPGHPRMQQLNAELAITNERLREEAKQVAVGIEDDLKVARTREAELQRGIAELTERALKSSDAQAKLISLEREAQSKRNTYDGLLQRLSEASSRRNNSSVSAMASLNESAEAATIPDSPKKGQMSVFAALGTFLIGMVIIIGRELLGGKASSQLALRPQAAAGTSDGVGAVGTAAVIPAFSATGAALPVRLAGADALAAYLAKPTAAGTPQRILWTGEAATQALAPTAGEFADRLASKAAAAVVIDLTGRPAVAMQTGGSVGQAGFAELVAGKAGFEDVVRAQPGRLWHRIGLGATAPSQWGATNTANVPMVFDALGAIYTLVLIVANREDATRLLEALEGQIDLGVVSQDPQRATGAPVEEGFLGYDVTDLTTIWLEPAKPATRNLFARKLAAKLEPVPA